MLLTAKVRKAKRLSLEDWRMLLAAAWWLPVTDLRLRWRGFKKAQAGLSGQAEPSLSPPAPEAVLKKVAYLVDAANRHHFRRFTCLPRALVLQRLLGNQGIATTLRIGVDAEDGQISGHAWVEYNGRPVGEPEDVAQQFQPLEGRGVVRS